MKAEITVPAVGESITEATIAEWVKHNGDYVNRDDILLVLETDKASVEVVAEHDGKLATKVEEGDTVEIGAVVGEIDTDASAPAGGAEKETETKKQEAAPTEPSASNGNGNGKAAQPSMAHPDLQKTMGPAAKKIVAENNLNPENIRGTGRGGRITKEDAMSTKSAPAPAPAPSAPKSQEVPLPQAKTPVADEVREPMSRMRKTIASRLVEAQQTAAILTTFNEIDMGNVMDLRKKYKDDFEKKYNIRLGFMGFFVKAAIEALKAFPKVNASIDGDDIVYHNYYNIGMAVSTPKGLVVPAVRNAEQLSVAEIEMAIKHYAVKARDGKITIDDLRDGTFTITNGGVFGSLMSTPILNPPQTGILGLHKIEERPVAVNGEVKVRPMMYVALSYDHRLIDGSESVQFLVKIKECIEDPARILLEI